MVRLRMQHTVYTLHDKLRGTISISGKSGDDAVLLKSDGFPTYHLASVVDDHLMHISTVVRGEEWISSYPKHHQLYQAFGWSEPSFIHLPLLLNEKKGKISKREGGFDLESQLRAGILPCALVNYVYYLGRKRGDDAEMTNSGIFYDIESMVEDVGEE